MKETKIVWWVLSTRQIWLFEWLHYKLIMSLIVKLKDHEEVEVWVLTCACVKRTRRFRRCVSGNCIGFESPTLHAASPDIFDIACPIDPPADPPINLVTANKRQEFVINILLIEFCSRWATEESSNNHHVDLWLHNTLSSPTWCISMVKNFALLLCR